MITITSETYRMIVRLHSEEGILIGLAMARPYLATEDFENLIAEWVLLNQEMDDSQRHCIGLFLQSLSDMEDLIPVLNKLGFWSK